MIPVRALKMHTVRAKAPATVTYHQPTSEGTFPGTGTLLAEVWAQGDLHHYRISLGEFVLLAPPQWLAVESYADVLAAGLTVPEALMPQERMAMEAMA